MKLFATLSLSLLLFPAYARAKINVPATVLTAITATTSGFATPLFYQKTQEAWHRLQSPEPDAAALQEKMEESQSKKLARAVGWGTLAATSGALAVFFAAITFGCLSE